MDETTPFFPPSHYENREDKPIYQEFIRRNNTVTI